LGRSLQWFAINSFDFRYFFYFWVFKIKKFDIMIQTRKMAILSMVVLGSLHFSCKPSATTPTASTAGTSAPVAAAAAASEKIVYVDIDTLLSRSDLYKQKKSELEAQQKVAEKAIAGKIQAFQTRMQRFQMEVGEIQQKANTIAPVDLKKLEDKFAQQEANLAKEQESLNSQRENAAMDLEQKLVASQADIKKNIDAYLSKLAKEKGYELILIKGSTGAVMYGEPRLDITDVVVTQLNAEYAANSKK
jgi:outer membrane protein